MTFRDMGDTTHDNVAHLVARLGDLELVAGYVTGSPDIRWTSGDWNEFPGKIQVGIDQGFTGSPVMWATVRDVENGAWTLDKAVNRTGWVAKRPTLYLGYPDTAQMAYDAGWRGDVWLVHPSDVAPTSPPPVPEGLHVVAVQWAFNQTYDWSTVFDPYWPFKPPENEMNVSTIPAYWRPMTGNRIVVSFPGRDGHEYVTTSEDAVHWTPLVRVT